MRGYYEQNPEVRAEYNRQANARDEYNKLAHECRCVFRHACTPEERAVAVRNLENARRTGDTNGVILAMTALQPCPHA